MPPHLRTSPPFIDSKIRQALPRLYAWYRRHQRPLPWRKNPTPYRVTVSEFMAQQTRMSTVLPYYHRWIRQFPNWLSLAKAPRRVVLRHWEGLGYYRRARFLHELARSVVRRPDRRLPSDPETLRSLPGIGDYTAGAIASIAFGIAEPAFDGNVARVLGRLLAKRGRVPNAKTLRAVAGLLVSKKNPGIHNQALMELGALVCLPKNPHCPSCPLQRSCPSQKKIPYTSRLKPTPSTQKESILVIRRGATVWLTQQHPHERWRGLWLLPTITEVTPNRKPVYQITYPYTRYRISAGVFTASRSTTSGEGRWFQPRQLRQAPIPTPHRKILNHLGIG
ncbi:MAG: A/G-specific adenine glycosylase [Verrucomicrobia bacterium]|nr:A/G-specific adenine glycosylase [Verrucomicrobiota bacterium]